MDLALLALFVATWAQLFALWYKMGKTEQKIKDICKYVLEINGGGKE